LTGSVFADKFVCRYRWGHYIGAGIIISGIFVALFPQLILKSKGGNTIQGILFFFLANIPTAFSGVYKEIAFKGDEGLYLYLYYICSALLFVV